MVLLLSLLLFLFVTSLLYFLGLKFWASPRSVVERVLGETREVEAKHPSLAFRDALVRLGDLVVVATLDGAVTGYDLGTGTQRWRHTVAAEVRVPQ